MEHTPLHFLSKKLEFPPVDTASEDGLLAVGGDLSPERLLLAYKNGIFPWFNDDSLILWWAPDPRMILYPDKVKVSKSMRKVIRDGACAQIERKGQDGTWITPEMKTAYMNLCKKGHAKSFEVWEDGELVGGLYGVDLGHVFCGESMFSLRPNASKYAFIKMAREFGEKGYKIIDCQVHTNHLESMGAELVSRKNFLEILQG